MNVSFLTYEQFESQYSTEEACAEAIYQAKWPNGFRCPRCSCSRAYNLHTRRHYQCADCGYQASLTAGTIMENTRTPLKKWFIAMFMISRANGINATRLMELIGVTYKTAWAMLMKIRHAMSKSEDHHSLTGSVRMNTFIMGYKIILPMQLQKPGERHLIIGESNNDNENNKEDISQIKIKIISDQHVKLNRPLPTAFDEFQFKYVDYTVRNIQKGTYRSRNRDSQSFDDLIQLVTEAQRWIYTWYISIGEKYLQKYLDEFCYRYNISRLRDPQDFRIVAACPEVFQSVVSLCSTTPAMTYVDIITSQYDKKHRNTCEEYHSIRPAI